MNLEDVWTIKSAEDLSLFLARNPGFFKALRILRGDILGRDLTSQTSIVVSAGIAQGHLDTIQNIEALAIYKKVEDSNVNNYRKVG